MLISKKIDRLCRIAIISAVVLSLTLMCIPVGSMRAEAEFAYINHLFDTGCVHEINIEMDVWDDFIASCEDERYAQATLVIDGTAFKNVAIRAKGNTSLSSVSSYGNDRYSFKAEFDHYKSSQTCWGLDKLCLNNLIQDATYLKDYIAYTLMNKMGVKAPLCAFAWIKVNGDDWGLYLMVEGVEDSFLARNGVKSTADLYKPDSLSFGGGRGNGRGFDAEEFFGNAETELQEQQLSEKTAGQNGMTPPEMPQGGFEQNGTTPPEIPQGDLAQNGMNPPGMPQENDGFGGRSGGMNDRRNDKPDAGGMGSDDTKLIYTDDEFDSYSNIFDNAKTTVTDADKARLIASLKRMNEGDAESSVAIDEVIVYMAVHNFMVNGDSYTGSMVHNYYLLEQDGILSMIPWDYNLSFGAFDGGRGGNATSSVNTSIDEIASSDRPMANWIMNSETYMARYHETYTRFIETVFDSGWFGEELERVIALISPYVEKDERGFYSYEQFLKGVSSLGTYINARVESVKEQLGGNTNPRVDASSISVSDMGSMGNMDGGKRENRMNERKPENDFRETVEDENWVLYFIITSAVLAGAPVFAAKFRKR